MHASHASRRLPPRQPAKSYGYYAKTILSYGCGLMAGYGVWTAINEINRVRVGTIFSVVVGLTGLVFFRWLNKEKVLREEQPEKIIQEIQKLNDEIGALRRLIESQAARIDSLELHNKRGRFSTLTGSQDDSILFLNSDRRVRKLSFDATDDSKQSPFASRLSFTGKDGASVRVLPKADQSLKSYASSQTAKLHQGRTGMQGRSGRGRGDGKEATFN